MQDLSPPVRKRLWLVRHGATIWNLQHRYTGWSDIPLSAIGRQQAIWAAQQLQPIRISVIYSSTLLRASETADIIARHQADPLLLKQLDAWREINFGAWEGLTYQEIAARFPGQLAFFSDPERFPAFNGESLLDVVRRFEPALAAIMTDPDWIEGDALLVSHGGTLRALLCRLLRMPLARQWQLRLDHGSLSAIDLLSEPEARIPIGTLALLNLEESMSTVRQLPQQFSGADFHG